MPAPAGKNNPLQDGRSCGTEDKMKRLIILFAALLLFLSAASAEEGKNYTLPLDLTPGMPLLKSNYLNGWHYKDPTIEMAAREETDGEKRWWVAEGEIRDGSQLRTMPANSFSYASHADGSRISRRANAVLSCDGDFWWRDVKWKGAYVLRQGVLYLHELTGTRDVLLIDEDGDFHIIHDATDENVPLPEEPTGPVMYNGKQIYNGFCFGPTLVENGKALTIEPDEHIVTERTSTPRLAICQMGEKKYAIVATYRNYGNLQDFAYLLENLGAKTAYNLDGGDSSMIFTGNTMINRNSSIREIGDLIYFASAWPEEGAQ